MHLTISSHACCTTRPHKQRVRRAHHLRAGLRPAAHEPQRALRGTTNAEGLPLGHFVYMQKLPSQDMLSVFARVGRCRKYARRTTRSRRRWCATSRPPTASGSPSPSSPPHGPQGSPLPRYATSHRDRPHVERRPSRDERGGSVSWLGPYGGRGKRGTWVRSSHIIKTNFNVPWDNLTHDLPSPAVMSPVPRRQAHAVRPPPALGL
jgi:hypothetical protein